MNNKIEGKAILITGASSGIGEATALLLAEYCTGININIRRIGLSPTKTPNCTSIRTLSGHSCSEEIIRSS